MLCTLNAYAKLTDGNGHDMHMHLPYICGLTIKADGQTGLDIKIWLKTQ